MRMQNRLREFRASLPVRGAWIEIVMDGYVLTSDFAVAPRAGSVD